MKYKSKNNKKTKSKEAEDKVILANLKLLKNKKESEQKKD